MLMRDGSLLVLERNSTVEENNGLKDSPLLKICLIQTLKLLLLTGKTILE